MNELPKLRFIRPLTESTTRFEGFVYEDSYEEVLACWDKYKDNLGLFMIDYTELYNQWEIYRKEKGMYVRDNFILYRDWLHDKLFQLEG